MVLMLVPFFLGACNKFLDIKPTGIVIPETEEQYRATLVNAYNKFPRDLGKLELRTDMVQLREDEPNAKEYYGYLYTWRDAESPETAIGCQWKDYYYVIYLANYLIENIDLSGAHAGAEYSQLVGEAYLLRAYAHFLLVNIYGPAYSESTAGAPGVPLALTTDTDKELPRSSVGEVYKQVMRDVERGLGYLTVERWEQAELRYRFSKDAALAFKCRLALYMGDWPSAIAAGRKVLGAGYELVDLTKSTQIAPGYYKSTESILALDYVLDDYVLAVLRPSEACVSLYNRSDDRRFRTLYKEPQLGVYTVYRGGAGESSAYRVTFRLGEVYLNVAEAAARAGDVATSREMLVALQSKRLRGAYRTKMADSIGSLGTGDALLLFIMDERARELAFEGHRWFDLRRGGQPEIVHMMDGKTYRLVRGDARYTMPIPREARENNSSL